VVRYEQRGRPLIEYYKVEKMGHAWSGGKDDLLFSDGKGPDASRLIWDFFKQFSR
jgi:poly(3-hydroxybutyrate) depolymerase